MMSVTNVQLATATYSAVNCSHRKRTVMEVPAGKGKSRIAAGIAYLMLLRSDVHVFMVYPNKGLKNRD